MSPVTRLLHYVLQYRLLVCFGQSGIHIRDTKGRNELKAGQISKFVPLSEDNKESSKEFQGDDNGSVQEDVWGLGLSCLDVDVEYGSEPIFSWLSYVDTLS